MSIPQNIFVKERTGMNFQKGYPQFSRLKLCKNANIAGWDGWDSNPGPRA